MKKIGKILFGLGIVTIFACNDQSTSTSMNTINDGPIEIGEYSKYDLDTWMRPYWQGRVVHNETVALLGPTDKAQLLYKPQEIISVKDYQLKNTYEEGKDYKIDENGMISLTESTSFPFMSEEEYWSGTKLKAKNGDEITATYYGEDMYLYQMAITYSHNQFWDGYIPQSYKNRYVLLKEKLERGEDVTFFFYGDSITAGCNCSEMMNKDPGTPPWTQLFTEYVAKQFGYKIKYITPGKPSTYNPRRASSSYGEKGTITYINCAVGGWTSRDGTNHFNEYVKPFLIRYGCDLYVNAFGMNDGGKEPSFIKEVTKELVDLTLTYAPDTSVALVATMIPNPDVQNDSWAWNLNQPKFEDELKQLAEDYEKENVMVGVSTMTSVSKSILEKKRFRDITGNNINHPSDFFVRIYAQTLFETVFGY